MTVFLIIVVVALLGVTFWQMSKILKLSKPANHDSSQIANDKDNSTQGYLMLCFVILLYIFMFYSFWNWGDLYLPEAASAHGVDYDTLMFISIALIMFVQLVTQFLLYFFELKLMDY